MRTCCQNILDDFKNQWVRFLGCELIFKIISLALLGPITAWIVFQLIELSGSAAISNVEIATFLLSPLGWITLVMFAGLGWAVMFLGQSGLLLIQFGHLNDNPQTLSQAIMSMIHRATALIQLALIFVVLFLLVASPFLILALIIYRWLLSESDINYYLSEQPSEFLLAIALGGILSIGLSIVWSFVYARTLFALPECILNLRSPLDSLKRSYQMSQSQALMIFKCLIGWIIVSSLVFVLVVGVVQVIEFLALRLAGESIATLAIVIGLLLTLNLVAGTAATVFANLTHALLIGRLYWAVNNKVATASPATGQTTKRDFPGLQADTAKPDSQTATFGVARFTFKRAIFPVMLIVLMTSFGFCWLLLKNVKFEDDIQVTAHRGSSKEAPENTLSAIRQAIKDGADYAEIDVQETSDGVIVVMHDSDFMRIAGQKQNIWDTTYEELRMLDAGQWFNESFAGERVPTLQETIDAANGKIKLNIELKFNGHDEKLVARTMDLVLENDFVSQCVVSSLEHASLKEASAIAPKIKTGAIVGASIGDLSRSEADFIAINVGQVDRALIRSLHRQGKEIHVWTVNDITIMSDMIDLDVDNILTDEPKKLIHLLDERRKLNESERLLLAFRKLIEY